MPLTKVYAFGISAGGAVVKSVAEYSEVSICPISGPCTPVPFVDGVIDVASINFTLDNNDIIATFGDMLNNWNGYLQPNDAFRHFDTNTPIYAAIQEAGFPAEMLNTNATLAPPGSYGVGFPMTPNDPPAHRLDSADQCRRCVFGIRRQCGNRLASLLPG